jgi:uncharacterized membrane protein
MHSIHHSHLFAGAYVKIISNNKTLSFFEWHIFSVGYKQCKTMQNKTGEPEMAKIVERNIAALLERRKKEEQKKTTEEKIADAITAFTGSMPFVYLHLFIFSAWIIWNAGLISLKPFDPTFVILAMWASVEAIFLSTFVLISQNRMNREADRRAELDLQISLLTEHEVTRLITIVSTLAEKLNIEIPRDELSELSKDVRPEKVMDTIDKITTDNL